MDIYGMSELDVEEYTNMYLPPHRQTDHNSFDKMVQELAINCLRTPLTLSLENLSNKEHAINQQSLIASSSVDAEVSVKKDNKGKLKVDASATYERKSKDETETFSGKVKVDSEGNIEGKVKFKKDF